MSEVQVWCDKANAVLAALYPHKAKAAFFPEPFDLADIHISLQDNKFYVGAYLVCGNKERWYVCAKQLPELFLEFVRNEIDEAPLLRLTALMFQWAGRFFDDGTARQDLIRFLYFVPADRINHFIRMRMHRTSDDRVEWCHPWHPRVQGNLGQLERNT